MPEVRDVSLEQNTTRGHGCLFLGARTSMLNRPCNSSTQSSLPSTYVALDASDFEKAVSGD